MTTTITITETVNDVTVTEQVIATATIGIPGPAGADGAATFLALTDTPNAYTGQGGKAVTVKSDVSGLEFTTIASGVTDHGALTGLADDDHTQYFNQARGDARYYTQAQADAALATHAADTTSVHGITDTSALVLTNDARLSDARTPTAHASSHASAGSDPLTLAQSQITNLVSDLAGKAPAIASYITTTTESGLSGETVLGSGVIMAGLAASRPAAATAGRLYYATDTDTISRDNGSTWDTLTLDWSNLTSTPTTLAGYGITDAASDTELSTHAADTTSVHGIADTSALVLTSDSRLSDSRTPTGSAGGVLSGTYPNPGFAADMATQAELDAHEADTTSVHGIADTSTLYRTGGTDVALGDGGTGASLADPNADRILFWDDSAGQMTWLTAGTNLTITGTTIDAAGGGSGAPTDATYIVQTANGSLSAEQALGSLATGLLKNTTSTGVLTIATAGTDYAAPLASNLSLWANYL